MAQKKPNVFGKNLLEGEPLKDFRDIVTYLTKNTVAEAMDLNWKTLDKNLKDFGRFKFENFAELGKNMGLEEAKVIEIMVLAFKQYLKERKTTPKK